MRVFYKCSLRIWLIFLAAASAFMLGSALVAQYGFGLHPCELCLYQRYPYAAIVALGLAGAMLVKSPRALWALVALCGLLLLADAGLAAYHAGVESGIFPGPSACSSTARPSETIEEMRLALMNAPLVPCNQPMLQVLGVSMAGWNAMAALLLAVATFVVIRKTKS